MKLSQWLISSWMTVLSILVGSSVFESAVVSEASAHISPFVRTEGKFFIKDGKRWRFVGVNNYPLVTHDPPYTAAELDDYFTALKSDGIEVVRTWVFNRTAPAAQTTGNFRYLADQQLRWNEGAFQQLDLVLERAQRHHMQLSLVLVDQWQGKKGDYCRWSNDLYATTYDCDPGDAFHTDPQIKTLFKEHIAVLTDRMNTINGRRYRDDPTIVSWELGNELRYITGEDTKANTAGSQRLAVLTAWYAEMSAYLRSKDTHHLISTGSQSQFYDYHQNDRMHNGTYYGGDYTLQHSLPNIDYFDFHFYPYEDHPRFKLRAFGQKLGHPNIPTANGLLAQFSEYITAAKNSNKPVIVGEWAVDKRNTQEKPFTAYPRAVHFKRILEEFFGRGGDGFIIWHYGVHAFDDNNYNITPEANWEDRYRNNNQNDDDQPLRTVIRTIAQQLK